MEFAKIEITRIEEIVKEVAAAEVNELNELQLALVGGGTTAVDFG